MTEKPYMCKQDEYGDWYCRDITTNKGYNLVSREEMEVADNLLMLAFDGGIRDIGMIEDMLKEWNKKHSEIYDDIFEAIESCHEYVDSDKLSFYCALDGIKNGARDYIEDYIEDEYCPTIGNEDMCDEFKDYVREVLDDSELDYNYIAWGCNSSPDYEVCDLLTDTMREGDINRDQLDEVFKKWKEENWYEEEED